jgi:general stress protein 26
MDHAIDLAAMTPAAAWAWLAGELQAAVASARHPLHLVTLATVTADGAAESRTVVVRRFDATAREVWFHTDARSPKAADIRRDPRVCLHWYDAGLRLQVRIAARATLHHLDDVAHRAWAAAMPMSRACYMAPVPPGTVIAGFAPAPASPAPADDTGLAHFAAVCCRFDAVEILSLHAAGHQRVRLRLNATPLAWSVLAP